MNKCFIVGNLTRDPDTRITQAGITVCSFSVAVNRRRAAGQEPQADFFRVTAWRGLAENCQKFLAKGRKVCVVGPVSVSTYQGNDGVTRANLEITADDVEFLTPKGEQPQENTANAVSSSQPQPTPVNSGQPQPAPANTGYVEVDGEDLPF